MIVLRQKIFRKTQTLLVDGGKELPGAIKAAGRRIKFKLRPATKPSGKSYEDIVREGTQRINEIATRGNAETKRMLDEAAAKTADYQEFLKKYHKSPYYFGPNK